MRVGGWRDRDRCCCRAARSATLERGPLERRAGRARRGRHAAVERQPQRPHRPRVRVRGADRARHRPAADAGRADHRGALRRRRADPPPLRRVDAAGIAAAGDRARAASSSTSCGSALPLPRGASIRVRYGDAREVAERLPAGLQSAPRTSSSSTCSPARDDPGAGHDGRVLPPRRAPPERPGRPRRERRRRRRPAFARGQMATVSAVLPHLAVIAEAQTMKGRRFGNLVARRRPRRRGARLAAAARRGGAASGARGDGRGARGRHPRRSRRDGRDRPALPRPGPRHLQPLSGPRSAPPQTVRPPTSPVASSLPACSSAT